MKAPKSKVNIGFRLSLDKQEALKIYAAKRRSKIQPLVERMVDAALAKDGLSDVPASECPVCGSLLSSSPGGTLSAIDSNSGYTSPEKCGNLSDHEREVLDVIHPHKKRRSAVLALLDWVNTEIARDFSEDWSDEEGNNPGEEDSPGPQVRDRGRGPSNQGTGGRKKKTG